MALQNGGGVRSRRICFVHRNMGPHGAKLRLSAFLFCTSEPHDRLDTGRGVRTGQFDSSHCAVATPAPCGLVG